MNRHTTSPWAKILGDCFMTLEHFHEDGIKGRLHMGMVDEFDDFLTVKFRYVMIFQKVD